MSKLDELVMEVALELGASGYDEKDVAAAKQHVLKFVRLVIGPDERYETPPGNRDRIARNELRAELRKKVEEL